VEINGLPSMANGFTIDGLDTNDHWRGVNSTGATGLQLGLDAIQEVSVNTVAYAADSGRSGAAHVNYVTKSGTNSWHGDAFELWNGSAMNANNYFLNANGKPKPPSNVNEFGASAGGPIVTNRLFFFTSVEGVRLVLPVILNSTLPTPAYQSFVLQQLPLGGKDTVLGTNLPPQPGEVPLYKSMFSLMGDTSQGVPRAVLGCPFDVGGGSPAIPNDGTGCLNAKTFAVSQGANETLFTVKVDYDYNQKNSFWYRFQLDNGTRTQVDAVNSIFNTITPVPMRSGAGGWTHIFGPNVVNQFNPGFSYRSTISDLANPAKARAALPIAYSNNAFGGIGSSLQANPSGQAVTTWQLVDNLAWTRDKQAFRFGTDMHRSLLNFIPGALQTPSVLGLSLPEFTFGAGGSVNQGFPKFASDRLATLGLDAYAMNTIRVTPKLTLTAALRASWNSDPVSRHDIFSRLSGSFGAISHDINAPLNLVISANQEELFPATPLLQWEPRAAIAYEVIPKTIFRAGFGVFGQPLQALFSTDVATNPPSFALFAGGLFGNVGGIAIAPGVPNSAVDAVATANQAFQKGFASGVLSCVSALATPGNCVPTLGSFSDYQTRADGTVDYPYSMQWTTAIERQFGANFGLNVQYVGTRGVKMFYSDHPNGIQKVCQGCFAPFPFNATPDPRFGFVASVHTGSNSSYHGLQITGQKRMGRGLSFQVNYTWSHCLDTISNGGKAPFNANAGLNSSVPGALGRLYGNCDFDVRHSLNGSYVYELPFHSANGWIGQFVGGWQVSGTVFLRGGLPFSIFNTNFSSRFSNTSPTLYANRVPGQDFYAKQAISGVTQRGTIQWVNPSAFQSVWDSTTSTCFPSTNPQNCQNGNLGRNTLRAPDFRWTDLAIAKRFKITERVAFRFSAQFYNLFNHPNFGIPNGGFVRAGISGKPATLTNFGTINSTVAPATGLLGSGIGGDSSGRMIAIEGRIHF
jgi:hypothetical protein